MLHDLFVATSSQIDMALRRDVVKRLRLEFHVSFLPAWIRQAGNPAWNSDFSGLVSKRGQVPTGPRARSPGDEAVQAVEALDWEDPSQGALDQCPAWEMGPSTMLEA